MSVHVMCSHGSSFFGRAVRWFTHAYASHAAYVVKWREFEPHVTSAGAPLGTYRPHNPEDLVVVEADSPGVIARRRLDEVTDPRKLYRYDLSDSDRSSLYRFLSLQLGKPYDWAAIGGIVLRRDREASGRWICSELVGAASAQTSCPLFHTTQWHEITPRDISISPVLVEMAP